MIRLGILVLSSILMTTMMPVSAHEINAPQKIEYDISDHNRVYTKKNSDYVIKVVWDDIIKGINEEFIYGYNDVVIFYNDIKLKSYYPRDMFSDEITIINAEKTNLFCDKEYVVITFRNYREYSNTGAENDYSQLFMDIQQKGKKFSFFSYDAGALETRGPVSLAILKQKIKYECHADYIEFLYDDKSE